MAALALLLLRPSVEHVFERIEWSVLIFFGALFVMAGGLEASGALSWLEALILRASMGNPIITTLLVLWLAAIASSLVDNIPITIAIIPVIQHLESQGVQVMPLWWALAFGAGFGGNGTIIGSTANVVAVQLTKRMDNPITSIQWMRYGIPVMLLSGIIASIYLALAYPLFLK
jgi:Na+/H+ antiporter NhaD/arsenite permease-like protein